MTDLLRLYSNFPVDLQGPGLMNRETWFNYLDVF